MWTGNCWFVVGVASREMKFGLHERPCGKITYCDCLCDVTNYYIDQDKCFGAVCSKWTISKVCYTNFVIRVKMVARHQLGVDMGNVWVIQSSECCHLKGKYYAFLFDLSFSVQYRCWCM